jgi:hypothetical protein
MLLEDHLWTHHTTDQRYFNRHFLPVTFPFIPRVSSATSQRRASTLMMRIFHNSSSPVNNTPQYFPCNNNNKNSSAFFTGFKDGLLPRYPIPPCSLLSPHVCCSHLFVASHPCAASIKRIESALGLPTNSTHIRANSKS